MNRRTTAILVGGFIAGTCDILYAMIYSYWRAAVPPTRILQLVASGLLGGDAYSGGMPVALLGLALHFLIALAFAAAYVVVSRSWQALIQRPILWGATFGVFIYLFMNLVVLPLSAMPPRTQFPSTLTIVTSLIVHMFLFGVPIALAARRAAREEGAPSVRPA